MTGERSKITEGLISEEDSLADWKLVQVFQCGGNMVKGVVLHNQAGSQQKYCYNDTQLYKDICQK